MSQNNEESIAKIAQICLNELFGMLFWGAEKFWGQNNKNEREILSKIYEIERLHRKTQNDRETPSKIHEIEKLDRKIQNNREAPSKIHEIEELGRKIQNNRGTPSKIHETEKFIQKSQLHPKKQLDGA